MLRRGIRAGLVVCCFLTLPTQLVFAQKVIVGTGGGNPPSPDCIYITALHQTLPPKDFRDYIRKKTLEGWTRERSVSAGFGQLGRIWLCPPPSTGAANAVGTAVGIGIGIGLGGGHRKERDNDRPPP